MTVTCLCGRVRLTLARRPDYVNACNCTLCRKSGAQWAYFAPPEVTVAGATRLYCREDKPDPAAAIHSCAVCGATTHFTLTASAIAKFGNAQLGVNMLLAEETDLAGIERRFPDGRAWSGGAAFGYVRAAEVIGG